VEENPKAPDEWTEEDFQPDERVAPKGILYEKPKFKHLIAPLFIVLLCCAFTLLSWYSPRYGELLWVSGPSIFRKGEYWRLFTALFVHSGLLHLLSNMPLLFVFGWFLRTYFGFVAFPIAAVAIGAVANAATLYFYHDHIRMVGASGMVYGVVGLWITLYLRYEVRHRFWAKLLRVAGVSLVLLFPSSYSPDTSYLAHIFGFALGIVTAGVLILLGNYDSRQRAIQGG
jgi:rhomboid protease GluP